MPICLRVVRTGCCVFDVVVLHELSKFLTSKLRFFEFSKEHYLLIVDYFSKWPEISKLDNLSAKNVIS